MHVASAQQITLNTVNIEGNARIGDAAILSRAGIVRGALPLFATCAEGLRWAMKRVLHPTHVVHALAAILYPNCWHERRRCVLRRAAVGE